MSRVRDHGRDAACHLRSLRSCLLSGVPSNFAEYRDHGRVATCYGWRDDRILSVSICVHLTSASSVEPWPMFFFLLRGFVASGQGGGGGAMGRARGDRARG